MEVDLQREDPQRSKAIPAVDQDRLLLLRLLPPS
jgi:hypothetical protein